VHIVYFSSAIAFVRLGSSTGLCSMLSYIANKYVSRLFNGCKIQSRRNRLVLYLSKSTWLVT